MSNKLSFVSKKLLGLMKSSKLGNDKQIENTIINDIRNLLRIKKK